MEERELRKLGRVAYSQSLKPLQKQGKLKHAYIMGFDTEYDAHTGELLSRQYSFKTGGYFFPVDRDGQFTIDLLISDVKGILQDQKIKRQGRTITVFLGCYYSLAEISKIDGFFEDERVRAREFSQTINASIRAHRKLRIVIFDLFHFFMGSLAKTASLYGLEKIEGIDRANISRKNLCEPQFREYAIQDARLCERILHQFREELWETYQIDVLRTETPASTSLAVYRQNYLESVIDNDCMVLRRNALRAYWGGRSEALFRGTRQGDFHSCDITSLYPNSAILLGCLPRASDWRRSNSLQELLHGDVIDGIVRVRFKFPPDTQFPCLPVFKQRLLFPLEGESNCTISELRVAKEMGAQLILLDGWYYQEGTDSLGEFLSEQLKEKDKGEKTGNKSKRHLHKLMANSIIGKFVQRIVKTPLSYYQELAQKHQIPISSAYHLIDPDLPRDRRVNLGAGWCPEWGTLILGKARALMAKLLNSCSSSLHISTDSILMTGSDVKAFDTTCKEIGLSWKDEYGQLDQVSIVRSKLYALVRNGEVKKCAHHALHLPQTKSGRIIINALRREKECVKYRKKKNLKLRESMRYEKKFFSTETVSMKLNLFWDGKRHLLTNGETSPLQKVS